MPRLPMRKLCCLLRLKRLSELSRNGSGLWLRVNMSESRKQIDYYRVYLRIREIVLFGCALGFRGAAVTGYVRGVNSLRGL